MGGFSYNQVIGGFSGGWETFIKNFDPTSFEMFGLGHRTPLGLSCVLL